MGRTLAELVRQPPGAGPGLGSATAGNSSTTGGATGARRWISVAGGSEEENGVTYSGRTEWREMFNRCALELIALTSTQKLGKSENVQAAASDAAAPALMKIERAAIASSTPITYLPQELLLVVYEHLKASGLHTSASALAKEAGLHKVANHLTSASGPTAPTPGAGQLANASQAKEDTLKTPATAKRRPLVVSSALLSSTHQLQQSASNRTPQEDQKLAEFKTPSQDAPGALSQVRPQPGRGEGRSCVPISKVLSQEGIPQGPATTMSCMVKEGSPGVASAPAPPSLATSTKQLAPPPSRDVPSSIQTEAAASSTSEAQPANGEVKAVEGPSGGIHKEVSLTGWHQKYTSTGELQEQPDPQGSVSSRGGTQREVGGQQAGPLVSNKRKVMEDAGTVTSPPQKRMMSSARTQQATPAQPPLNNASSCLTFPQLEPSECTTPPLRSRAITQPHTTALPAPTPARQTPFRMPRQAKEGLVTPTSLKTPLGGDANWIAGVAGGLVGARPSSDAEYLSRLEGLVPGATEGQEGTTPATVPRYRNLFSSQGEGVLEAAGGNPLLANLPCRRLHSCLRRSCSLETTPPVKETPLSEAVVEPRALPVHIQAAAKEVATGSLVPSKLHNIIISYLRQQHRQACLNSSTPVATIPPMPLLKPYVMPHATRFTEAPTNLALRLSRREGCGDAGGRNGARLQRHYIHSRFKLNKYIRQDGGSLIQCGTFLPDTDHFCVGTDMGELRVLVASTGDLVEMYDAHSSPVHLVQTYAPSSGSLVTLDEGPQVRLLSSSKEEVKLWDVARLAEEGDVPAVHTWTDVSQGRFDPHGELVISVTQQAPQEVRIYDIKTGQLRCQLSEEHSNQQPRIGSSERPSRMMSACYSPHTSLVLWGSTLWDPRVPTALHTFDQFTEFSSGCFHPNGLEIILNSEVWDLRTYKLLRSVPALDFTTISFNSTGDVIYARLRHPNDESPATMHNTRRVKHPLYKAFRTLDAIHYEVISTFDVGRCVWDLALDQDDSQVAVMVMDVLEQDRVMNSAIKMYDVGLQRVTGAEGDDDDEVDEDEESDEDEDDEDEDLAAAAEDGEGNEEGDRAAGVVDLLQGPGATDSADEEVLDDDDLEEFMDGEEAEMGEMDDDDDDDALLDDEDAERYLLMLGSDLDEEDEDEDDGDLESDDDIDDIDIDELIQNGLED